MAEDLRQDKFRAGPPRIRSPRLVSFLTCINRPVLRHTEHARHGPEHIVTAGEGCPNA